MKGKKVAGYHLVVPMEVRMKCEKRASPPTPEKGVHIRKDEKR